MYIHVNFLESKMFNRRAVFLDRDGTLIESIHRPGFPENSPHKKEITAPFKEDELKLTPDVYFALSRLKEARFLRIMVTNQPDVAHGYMGYGVWRKIQKKVVDTLGLDDVFMCRHRAEDNCPFKKPSPLMLQSAADKWGIDLSQSWMIGDTDIDMQTGRAAGCRVVLVDHFYNSMLSESTHDHRANSLMGAVEFVIDQQKQA